MQPKTDNAFASIIALVLTGFVCLIPLLLQAAETSPEDVKVAITYNFLKMVNWGHLEKNKNLNICVDASRTTLRAFEALNQKKLPGQSAEISVINVRGKSKLYESCHMLYFNKIQDKDIITELYRLAEHPILVLSESKEDVYYRSMVNIFTKSEMFRGKSSSRIAYLLNECRIKHAQLELNPVITEYAELVNRLCDPIEFTLKVLKYVSWPEKSAPLNPEDKVMLFCNSKDNREISLDSIHGKELGERLIEVVDLTSDSINDCDAIFFSPHMTDSERKLLKKTHNLSMLTFSTHEKFLDVGGMIQLDINHSSNKLPISVDNCKLQRASLTLSSKVLRQATWVNTKCNSSTMLSKQPAAVEGAVR